MAAITPEERLRRRLEDRVRRFMDEQGLWPADDRLLVAVSGGPDSTALLLILSRLAARRGLSLSLAYYDHGLRSEEEAATERGAVAALTKRCELPLVTGGGDVRGEAKRLKVSIEDAARRQRYGFLGGVAREAGCTAVATGHTLDDQAETVLMHVLRGAGLAGLAGMSARSPWPFRGADGIDLVRPLLGLRRAETAAYCDAADARPVTDASNRSLAFQRNRVRHELLPAMRRFNPRVDEAFVRLAAAARDGVEFVDAVATTALRDGDVAVRFERGELAAWPSAPRLAALRLGVQRLLGDGQGLSERHLSALDRLLLRGRTGDRLDLPRGAAAELRRDALVLHPRAAGPEALPEGRVCLTVPGEARLGSLFFSARNGRCEVGYVAAVVAAEAAGGGLTVRRRRRGDRMQPAGMSGTKKLQDLFVDAHIPRDERDAVPIFANERGIVWAGGLRIADWARPRPGADSVTLSYRRA